MIRVLGIDPGIRGGIACLSNGTVLFAIDIPVMGEKAAARVNASELMRLLNEWRPIDHACIERAQAMPKQGSSSGFLYGRAVGAIEATIACAGIPLTVVEPAIWKKYLGLRGKDKEASRQRALMLFPTCKFFARKMDHGRAEAALIARFASVALMFS